MEHQIDSIAKHLQQLHHCCTAHIKPLTFTQLYLKTIMPPVNYWTTFILSISCYKMDINDFMEVPLVNAVLILSEPRT